jgi:hypothetical protein
LLAGNYVVFFIPAILVISLLILPASFFVIPAVSFDRWDGHISLISRYVTLHNRTNHSTYFAVEHINLLLDLLQESPMGMYSNSQSSSLSSSTLISTLVFGLVGGGEVADSRQVI